MTTSNRRARLIIICGLPGSGKTTIAKKLERQFDAIRLCPDEWMDDLSIDLWDQQARAKIQSLQWKLARQLLRLGQTVIIEWGTWSRSERDQLRTEARSLGAAVELQHVTAPPDVLAERVQRRGTENPPITLEQIREWEKAFDVPTWEEIKLYDNPMTST